MIAGVTTVDPTGLQHPLPKLPVITGPLATKVRPREIGPVADNPIRGTNLVIGAGTSSVATTVAPEVRAVKMRRGRPRITRRVRVPRSWI
jgi:hypothetical protein